MYVKMKKRCDWMNKQEKVTSYYDNFSKIYNLVSSKRYYHKIRKYAIDQLDIQNGDFILNVPCGTGVNFSYFNKYLQNSGKVIGVDLSDGMLNKAKKLILKKEYSNIKIVKKDVTTLNDSWGKSILINEKFDIILCDLGLSGFPSWKDVIQNLYSLLKKDGKLVIFDFYIQKDTIRSKYIRYFGKGEVNRNIPKYVSSIFNDVSINQSFKSGDMFVATIIKTD